MVIRARARQSLAFHYLILAPFEGRGCGPAPAAVLGPAPAARMPETQQFTH